MNILYQSTVAKTIAEKLFCYQYLKSENTSSFNEVMEAIENGKSRNKDIVSYLMKKGKCTTQSAITNLVSACRNLGLVKNIESGKGYETTGEVKKYENIISIINSGKQIQNVESKR